MTPLLISPVPPEMIQERQSAAISGKLDDILAEITSHLEDTASRTKSETIESILDIKRDCKITGWDGYDANTISANAADEAELFVKLIPYSVSLPHVAPTPAGAISFEWRRGKNNILLITVSGMQKLAYAAIIDGVTKIHGVETFIESVPQRIDNLLVEHFRA